MKRRINLFTQRASSRKVFSYYVIARRVSLGIFALLILVMFGLGGAFYYFNARLQNIQDDTLIYTRYILSNQTFSLQLQEFVFKYKLLRSYLEDDARSYLYYTTLIDLLDRTSASNTLTAFSIDKDHNTDFTLTFASYDDAIVFVEQLESPIIFEVFSSLNLAGFDITSKQTTSYSLTLSGTFIPIDTNGS